MFNKNFNVFYIYDGQCIAITAVFFPATEHHRLLAGTKLYCLQTETGQTGNCLTESPMP